MEFIGKSVENNKIGVGDLVICYDDTFRLITRIGNKLIAIGLDGVCYNSNVTDEELSNGAYTLIAKNRDLLLSYKGE